jgi:hypothetical protein
MATTKTETPIQSKLDEYFEQNSKFFGSNDSNGKKAFFCLGQYTRVYMKAT